MFKRKFKLDHKAPTYSRALGIQDKRAHELDRIVSEIRRVTETRSQVFEQILNSETISDVEMIYCIYEFGRQCGSGPKITSIHIGT